MVAKGCRHRSRHTIAAEQAEAVRLASYEALANVVEHAYPGDRVGVVGLDAVRRVDRLVVLVTVTDYDRWRLTVVDPRSARGHGLLVIYRLADHAEVTAGPLRGER